MSNKLTKICLSILISLFISLSSASQVYASSADFNTDGKVDIFDYNLLVSKFGNPYTIFDYNLLIQQYGITTPSTPTSPSSSANCPQPANKTLVGVRFFMAYFSTASNGHYNRSTHEQWLADAQWQDRWPYYTQVRSNTSENVTVDIHQDSQQIIDQEIQLASSACLDYWALETSPLGSKFHLDMYLKSPYKHLLKFALITPMSSVADADKWDRYVDKMIELFKDPQYVKVSGRPLLYMEQIDPFISNLGEAVAKQRLAEFTQKTKNAVGAKPYLVLLNWASGQNYDGAKNLGFNARALYNCRIVRSVSGAPYNDLASDCEARWDMEKNKDLPYVPTAQITYDARARTEAKSGEDADTSTWYKQGTPQQIANHVKKALDWVKANPTSAAGNTVLISAWSDYTEGGWLEPTLKEGNARLNALSKILGGVERGVPESPYLTSPQPPHTVGQVTNLSVASGSTFPANQPIIITGQAPAASRLNFKLKNRTTSIISTSAMNFYKPDMTNFTVTLDGLPKGGPHTLTISSPDIETVSIPGILIN